MARVCEFFGNGPPVETKVATSHPASPAPMLLKLNLGSPKDLVAGTAQPKTQAIKTTANRQNLAFIADSPSKAHVSSTIPKRKKSQTGHQPGSLLPRSLHPFVLTL